MECIYSPELSENSVKIRITDEEAKHIRALRLKVSDCVIISNGKGLSAESIIEDIDKNAVKLITRKFLPGYSELNKKLGLAIGILSDKSRFEFALEKAVELGISDFFPLITKFCEKDKINYDRLNSKALAAMKQSKRSVLPKIHKPLLLNQINTDTFKGFDDFIIADMDGVNPSETGSLNNTIIFIGPEGGFDIEEIKHLEQFFVTTKWNLSNRRLRAETSAVAGLSIAVSKII